MNLKTESELNIDTFKEDPLASFYLGNSELYTQFSENFIPPLYYLNQYREFVVFKEEKTNFIDNKNEHVHRWFPYLEGFSSTFVKNMIKNLGIKKGDVILDPFAGCGTTIVTAKMLGIDSVGIEINPTMYFILKTKINWNVNINKFEKCITEFKVPEVINAQPPLFLQNERQFKPGILKNLLVIKQFASEQDDEEVRNLLLVALSSILLDCSNLKRSPSIGYTNKKYLTDNYPIEKFLEKTKMMLDDLKEVQKHKDDVKAQVVLGNSTEKHLDPDSINYTITSPPYLNFFDYPGNYKLEMCWLEHANSTKDLKKIKDEMIVCDNVSTGLIREYEKQPRVYFDPWLECIENMLTENIKTRESIRRRDYPVIVRKYFDEMYKVIANVSTATKKDGMLILVVGDSLVTDVYIPTDLILARIAEDLGFRIEKIQITRSRRSGIRRTFRLRETITYLRKN